MRTPIASLARRRSRPRFAPSPVDLARTGSTRGGAAPQASSAAVGEAMGGGRVLISSGTSKAQRASGHRMEPSTGKTFCPCMAAVSKPVRNRGGRRQPRSVLRRHDARRADKAACPTKQFVFLDEMVDAARGLFQPGPKAAASERATPARMNGSFTRHVSARCKFE